ncbi:hypothetical protein KIH87_12810 [Paraneptunicella aestuarii]|uniref:FliH/SctL family protein n=1 Tax=Paraneptunicella aestuarii TaxID=2831148 RepID=UPI001E4BB485|nr:hypothetical protein [Paraneptunicella aestuarii]UAA37590.1 hypothetical protein KIH87_12810 [Paraneptunicella aestuarii]
MPVIKSAPVKGSHHSFVPSSEVRLTPVQKQQAMPHQNHKCIDLDALTADERLELGREYLASLNEEARRELIGQTFESDFVELKDAARKEGEEKGFLEARNSAEEQFNEQIQNVRSELEQTINVWLSMVEQEEKQANWCIEQEETFVYLLTKALCKLLQVNLFDERYINELVRDLAAQYGKYQPKILYLPEVQFESFTEIKGDAELPFELKSDSNLSVGSYRLALQSGDIQRDLQGLFEQFIQELKNYSVENNATDNVPAEHSGGVS